MTHAEMSERLMQSIGLEESPIGIYYRDEAPEGSYTWDGVGAHFCLVGRLAAVRRGTLLAVDGENPGCMGAGFYLGYNPVTRPGFEYFLACDSEGNGERFKKTPQMALEVINKRQFLPAKGRYCVFQRLSDIPEDIEPETVAMFGSDADDISGLVWLAHYDRGDGDAVIAPFSAGCGSIVHAPRLQADQDEPKCVLGMLDPAARQKIEKKLLSFAASYVRFVEMVENIPGSFLKVDPWVRLKNR